MAASLLLVSRLVGGLLFGLTACQPQLLLPLYESADSSQLPPLRAYPGLEPISFCQLPAFPHQLVYVRGRYTSGNGESSDFQPLEARSLTEPACLEALELTLPSAAQLPTSMAAKFRAIHQDEDHRTKYLVVDAIGQYEQDKPHGLPPTVVFPAVGQEGAALDYPQPLPGGAESLKGVGGQLAKQAVWLQSASILGH